VSTRVKKQEIRKKEMASIKVKGTITRVFYEGKGIELTEAYTTKAGETINKRYTVWLKTPTTWDVGEELQVEGLYSAEIDNWTNPDGSPKLNREGQPGQSIKVSINNPYITPSDPAQIVKSLFEPTHSEPAPF
jgi:hypothetical protein